MLVFAGFLLLVAFIYWWTSKRRSIGIPGPFGWPLIGSLPSLAADEPHVVFSNWSKTYGPVYVVRLGAIDVLVVNDLPNARSVLLNRDLAGKTTEWDTTYAMGFGGKDLVFSSPNRYQNVHKALIRKHLFGSARLPEIEALVAREADSLCESVPRDARAFDCTDYVATSIGSIILQLTFGRKFARDDAKFREFRACVDQLVDVLAHTSALAFLPWLKHVPASPPRRAWLQMRASLATSWNFLDDYMSEAVRNFDPSLPPRTFADHLLMGVREENPHGDLQALMVDERFDEVPIFRSDSPSPDRCFSCIRVRATLLGLLASGIDTTTNTMKWVLARLVAHPEMQERIAVELLTGSGVTLLEAFLNETLRVHTIGPLVCHSALRTTTVSSYTIPAHMPVIVNLWALHRDPAVWIDPFRFDPSRFISGSNDVLMGKLLPFGMGHRMCLGRKLAWIELVGLTSALVKRFRFIGVNGESPCTEPKKGGILSEPKPFRIKAIQR